MLRITTWGTNGTSNTNTNTNTNTNPNANSVTSQAAFQTFQDLCNTLSKITGNGNVSWYVSPHGIVTVSEPNSYSVADAILKSTAAQTAIAKVLSMGFNIIDDQFLLDPSQVMPLTNATQSVPTGLSRN